MVVPPVELLIWDLFRGQGIDFPEMYELDTKIGRSAIAFATFVEKMNISF